MKRRSTIAIWALALFLALPGLAKAQSDDGHVSLGDLARGMRQAKQAKPGSQTEINNDNFTEMMAAAEQQKPWDSFKYSISPTGNSFQVSAPDVTCSLSFNSHATALLTDPFATRSLPDVEIAKLNGPAHIDGDTFEISVYNGSDWTLREVTVALTIVHPTQNSASYGTGKLVPASTTSTDNVQKLSDTTLLFHMKGSAAATTTAVFRQTLQSQLSPGDDWHWAIVDAKGMPPRPDLSLPSTLDPTLQPSQTQVAPQLLQQPAASAQASSASGSPAPQIPQPAPQSPQQSTPKTIPVSASHSLQ
jgi:hypothetical protein